MKKWPDNKILELLNIQVPIIQAPMAGHQNIDLAIAVAKAGGLGSLPCATISADLIRSEVKKFREQTKAPINLNFFCHSFVASNLEKENLWKEKLNSYYKEFNIDPSLKVAGISRNPFDEIMCDLVMEIKPEVVSFHFGLPEQSLLKRIKSIGTKIFSSATTVDEARFLAANGCDAVIAQGYEAGGHRAIFQSNNITTQVGTMALVPQIVDAINIPVIASGGISDARGIVAAFALGASAVQIGTAYLFTSEAKISDLHRNILKHVKDNQTVITNVFSGRPARGIENRMTKEVGPMSEFAPEFPYAGNALASLKKEAEKNGSADFSSLWSGQAAGLSKEMSAEKLTNELAINVHKIIQERFY